MDSSPEHRRWRSPSAKAAFSLVEILVSMTVLVLILFMTMQLVNNTSGVYSRTRGRIDTFQEARAAFEAMTRKISQAMLNTYWDYDYASDGTPGAYVRQSELQFICGPTKSGPTPLLPDSTNGGLQSTTHGIFFQAPLGYSSAPNVSLNNLLNATGYFVDYQNTKEELPNFLRTGAPDQYGFRLIEMNQPTEGFSFYDLLEQARATNNYNNLLSWFRGPVDLAYQPSPSSPSACRVLAKNIVGLVLYPHRSPNDPPPSVVSGIPYQLAPAYYYNSRFYETNALVPLARATRNQLPPLVQVTIVALDKASASRLVERQADRARMPDELGLDSLFQTPSTNPNATPPDDLNQYFTDLQTLEQTLIDGQLQYRIFSTEVSILQARWSEN